MKRDGGTLRTGELGLFSATALVMASMIGTGLFTTSGFLLADLKSPAGVLMVWLAGGVIAMLGALSYGALARRIPESGGEYLFLSRTLHPAAGYMAGWISLLVGFSAPLAAAAYAFGQYSQLWWPVCPSKLSGTLLILLCSTVHMAHVGRGALAQNAAVILKVLGIFVFAGLALTRLHSVGLHRLPPVSIGTYAVSLMWVSFSYSGWNAAVYLASEIRDPERNLPRALVLGTGLVTVLYLGVNTIFLYSASYNVLAGKAEIGRLSAEALGGPAWAQATVTLVAVILVSSVSAQVMAGPRVYAKMAEDGFLPRQLTQGDGPPRRSIVLQSLLSLALLWSTQFQWLLTYIGFTLGLCTAATTLGMIRLRLKEGDRLLVPGWPWAPSLFLLGTITTTTLSVLNKPQASLAGLATLGAAWLGWRFTTGRRTAHSHPAAQLVFPTG